MRKVYSWLNNHLEDNTLAVSLIQSEIESCDIVSHIFKAYEYLLINMNENEEKIVEGSIENSKTLRTAVIVELCKLLILVLKNAETASFSKSSNTDVKSKDKLSSVTWLSLQKMMCTPVLQNLINDLLKDDDVVQGKII